VSETPDSHLRDDVLAAYLDRALGTSARAVADAHLAACASCRDELVVLSALARSTSTPRRLLRVGGPLAAVAAGVLIVYMGTGNPAARAGAPGDRLRETTSVANPGSARLSAVTPLDGESISSDPARHTTFTWRRASPDAAYRLTVTDEGGSVRWAPETGDTTINLPDSVRLERGQTYYWYVDALGGDGRTRASSPRRLRIAP